MSTCQKSAAPPSGVYSSENLFWRHELLHRVVLADYPNRIKLFNAERDELESRFIAEAFKINHHPAAERHALTMQCFAEADRV